MAKTPALIEVVRVPGPCKHAVSGACRKVGFFLVVRKVCAAVITSLLLHPSLAIAQAYWRIESAINFSGQELPFIDRQGRRHGAISVAWAKEIVNIKNRLAQAANVDVEFVVIEGDRPNAFAGSAGGRRIVGINVGMLNLLSEDRDSVAAILGHEFGHHVRGHGDADASRKGLITFASNIFAAWLSAKGIRFGDSIASITGTVIDRSYSRDQEREADSLSLDYMVRTGFDLNGAIRLHSKLLSASRSSELPFLSTHPPGLERISSIERFIAANPSSAGGTSIASASVPRVSDSAFIEQSESTLNAFGSKSKIVQKVSLDSSQIYLNGLERPATINATIRPTFAILSRAGWSLEDTFSGTKRALGILAQCGIYADRIDILVIDAPEEIGSFSDSRAKALVRSIEVSRPAVFFVKENLQPKKFEFEVIAEANSRTRPELKNTVWIVRHAKDVGEGLARTLMYMFMNKYEVSSTPGSLFYSDSTSLENASLTDDQCERAVSGANLARIAR